MAKKTNDEAKLQANRRIGDWRSWKVASLLTIIGIVALVAAYAIVRLVLMQPVFESGPLLGIRIVLTILTFIFLPVGTISTGIGLALLVGAYIQEWQGRDTGGSHKSLLVLKAGLFVLGIGATVLTTLYILDVIEFSRQSNIYIPWWNIILQWPSIWYLVFSNPAVLLSPGEYVWILVAFISPFLALVATRRLGYPVIYHLLWFILALLFPFTLLILVMFPRYTVELGKRFSYATNALFLGIFWMAVGLFMLIPSNGDVVYIVGARWLGTDNPIVALLIVSIGFLFMGLGIAGVVSAILVTLGVMKPETLERMLRRFK